MQGLFYSEVDTRSGRSLYPLFLTLVIVGIPVCENRLYLLSMPIDINGHSLSKTFNSFICAFFWLFYDVILVHQLKIEDYLQTALNL